LDKIRGQKRSKPTLQQNLTKKKARSSARNNQAASREDITNINLSRASSRATKAFRIA